MIILKITDVGHSIDLPGKPGIKTPTEIDISRMNMGVVISILKKQGIDRYEIISQEKRIIREQNIKLSPIVIPEKITETIYVKEDNIELQNKVENIEKLLVGFLKDYKTPQQVVINNTTGNIKSKEIDEDEEVMDFIPTIDISGMTSKGNINQTTTINDNSGMEETANLLKSMNLKTKGKG